MLDQIDAALSILERLKNLFMPDRQSHEIDSIASRFVRLFEKHGIHRNQIPRFFGHGLTLADVASNEKLLLKLTHEMLQSVSELFAVRLEWLEGVDEEIYKTHDFYKHPEDYAEFLDQLIADDKHRVMAKLVLSADSSKQNDALLVLEEEIDYIGNEPVVRYHLCSGWVNKYWKSRADLTACIAITLNRSVHIHGWKKRPAIDVFCAGEGFIKDLYDLPWASGRGWLFRRRDQSWHPEDWVYDPAAFLKGVDAERDNFGITSALDRWLYYFDKGYMETGYYRENAHKKFTALHEKYK
ncbi:hypothetical protein [Methylobacter luteus]|uniref:hypothetical protein n=1 Tax=Methylobacter luteus TaxID=415 RepID=UPI0003F7E53F|nr:hypothetical protein [Methylobacter luteus]